MLTSKEVIDALGLRNASVVGDEITCSCPFTENHHGQDRHPSFGINVRLGVYNCFSCEESGNLVTLFEKVLGASRLEAMRFVYRDLTPDDISELMTVSEYSSHVLTPMEYDISRWSSVRHDYWKQRGFTEQTIGKWQLGYDAMTNRVTVPIYYHHVLMGWTKRRVDENDTPKWQHSPDFDKRHMLFGMDNVDGDAVILVEAPLSVIMLDQYGFHNAVASFGCNLNDSQAILLRSNYNRVLVFYDPDDAGRKGTMNALKKLVPFLDVYVVHPTRDDPAAMTKEECEQAINGSIIPGWLAGGDCCGVPKNWRS